MINEYDRRTDLLGGMRMRFKSAGYVRMDDMRRILHIDMDAFFSAVEQKRHPELVGKPVVVGGGGDPTKRGVVSTASYEARKFGIYSAMPLRMAHRLCPEAIFLPVDYEEYSRVSEEVKAILREFSPIMEDAGIDEAFLDLSFVAGPLEEIAGEIKKRIKLRGPALRVRLVLRRTSFSPRWLRICRNPMGLPSLRKMTSGAVSGLYR